MELLTIGWIMADPPFPNSDRPFCPSLSSQTGNEILWCGISLGSALLPPRSCVSLLTGTAWGKGKSPICELWAFQNSACTASSRRCSAATAASQSPQFLTASSAKCLDILPSPCYLLYCLFYSLQFKASKLILEPAARSFDIPGELLVTHSQVLSPETSPLYWRRVQCTHTRDEQHSCHLWLLPVDSFSKISLNLWVWFVLLFKAEIHKTNQIKSFQFQLFF